MDVETWQVLAGLSVVLVVIGVASSLGGFEPAEMVVMLVFIAMIVAALYVGWRVGQAIGER